MAISNLSFAQIKIALLYSTYSERHSTNKSHNIIEEITSWELLLMQNKISYKVIYDDDLESGIADEFDIIILPSVEFISADGFEELQNFLVAGKSIININSKLLYSENVAGNYFNLEALLGLNTVQQVSPESISYLHTISPNYLNHFITNEDDRVLQISTSNEPLICNDTNNNNCLAFGNVISDGNFISNKSSIIYGTSQNGKYLWTGFELNDVVGGKSDLELFKDLIFNAIKWMDDIPDVFLATQKLNGMKPAILTLEFNNALEPQLVEFLQKNNFNPNIIVSPMQKFTEEILKKFSNKQIILDLSSDLTEQNADAGAVVDLIKNFERDYEVKLNTILLNRIYKENRDLEFLKNIGIENILLNSDVTGNPVQNSQGLLVLPFSKTGLKSNSNGPVKFIHYQPKINCDKNYEDEFLSQLNQFDKTEINFTTPLEVKKWWDTKINLDAKIISVSEKGIEVQITNKNSEEISNVELCVNGIKESDKGNISITSNNFIVDHIYRQNSGTIVIALENLLPNSTKKLTIRFSDN